MNKTALNFFKELLAQPTPSGYETAGQQVVQDYMKQYADEVKVDVHGNVHGVINPKAKTRVMLAGHCDEIGLMVMHVTEKGFLHVSALGGVNVPLLQGERILIHTPKGDVPGVIGVKPIHMMTAKERENSVSKIHELWVDIGAKDRADALSVVQPGDPATIATGWIALRNNLVACRGLDDRAGAFVIADTLRLLKGKKLNVAVHAVSTVQEEVGLRGARTAAFGVDPHIGIAVDVGFSTDYPGMKKEMVGESSLGNGPILHRGPTYNHQLYDRLVSVAKKSRIKTQMQPEPRGMGTDAFAMMMTRSGAAAALVSVPSRYMHSPVEVISLKDAENSSKLLAALIRKLKAKETFLP